MRHRFAHAATPICESSMQLLCAGPSVPNRALYSCIVHCKPHPVPYLCTAHTQMQHPLMIFCPLAGQKVFPRCHWSRKPCACNRKTSAHLLLVPQGQPRFQIRSLCQYMLFQQALSGFKPPAAAKPPLNHRHTVRKSSANDNECCDRT